MSIKILTVGAQAGLEVAFCCGIMRFTIK